MNWKFKKIGKRAVFFTAAAIVLSAIIILSFTFDTKYKLKEKMDIVETRVNTMNHFIKDIEDDLKKGIYISSFRALLSLSQHTASNGTYIPNVKESFVELFINGTMDGKDMHLMKNSTFPEWVNRIQKEADKIDINADMEIKKVQIMQQEPWSIKVKADIFMVIIDKRKTSLWNTTREVISDVSIIGLEDALYLVNSHGKLTNTIKKSPFEQFINGNDMSNLNMHINGSYYIETNMSPSFLMRLEGNLSASDNGIESLINVENWNEQGFGSKDRSCVDYIYFGNQTTINSRINNTPSWFKLDSEHLKIYDAQDAVI